MEEMRENSVEETTDKDTVPGSETGEYKDHSPDTGGYYGYYRYYY